MKSLMSATSDAAMKPVWNRARALLTTAWVGSSWTIGYLVAPTLFKTLADSTLAGTIAGQMFAVQAWVSVVCALVLLAMGKWQGQKLSWRIVTMLLCTLIGYFALHPLMAGLRAAGLANPDVKWQFGMLHGVSSGIYLLQSILGAMLILERLEPEQSQER